MVTGATQHDRGGLVLTRLNIHPKGVTMAR
jgi:hypothetical protein